MYNTVENNKKLKGYCNLILEKMVRKEKKNSVFINHFILILIRNVIIQWAKHLIQQT